MSRHPPQFRETLAALQAHNDFFVGQFARAGARYRLAQSLTGIGLHGMSAVLEAGYAQLLKLALSYSTHEMLTTSSKKSPPPMFSADLSNRFSSRKIKVFRETVTLHTTNDRLKHRLVALADGSHTNIGVLAAAVRHVTLHGELSVYGAGLHLVSTREFLGDLTSCIFAHLDKSFLEFLSSRTGEV